MRVLLVRSLLAGGLALLLVGCGGGDKGPTAPASVASVVIAPANTTLLVGQSQQLTASTLAASGAALSGRSVTWSSSNSAVGTVSGTGLLAVTAPGATTITATSEGRVGTATITVIPVPVASVVVTPGTTSILVGQTVQLTAAARDSVGGALSGREVTWSSSDVTRATVSGTGLATALTVGPVSISGTTEGKSGTASISVLPVPVASVAIDAPPALIRVGQAVQLSAAARDSIGGALAGRLIAWSSNDATIASVSASGVLTGLRAGTVTISAASEGRSATATVTVTASLAPLVIRIAPATLTPGQSATLTGIGFADALAENRVTVRGQPAIVNSVSPTQLTFTVPCVNSGTVAVQVTTALGVGAPLSAPLTVSARPLARGESMIMNSADASVCNELTSLSASARYLVVVSSAATTANAQVDFLLSGNTPPPTASIGRIPAPIARAVRSSEAAAPDAHFAHLERERALYASLHASGAFRERPKRATTASAAPGLRAPPVVGDMREFYYNFGGCADSTKTFRGRAINIGTRAIIWEDSANTLQSSTDNALAGYYARLGRIFDDDQYEAIRSTFGDPLRRDAALDNDGRLQMVFTQRLNGSGAAAYVTSCDQSARNTTNRAGSNFGELFYGTVPTTAGSNVNSTTFPDGWFYFMARTVVHEVKHIASLSARVANGALSFESSWLEEGTARHAEEIWVRASLHRVPWKGNTGYGSAATNGIFCDFNPANATCNAADALRRPSYGMRRQFNEIRPKLLDPWDWSPYGDATGQTGSVFYQTVWSLVRYAIDRYGASDAAFLGALTNSVSSGTTNLASVSGVPMDRLIGGWGLALYADDYPGLGTANADVIVPTWNLRDIYAGLNADPAWRTRWTSAIPITPVAAPFGAFETTRTGLRGGAHAYFELSGAVTSPQLLRLRSITGGVASTNLRLSILRLQ
ncbi:MAG: hypothetical protein CK550_00810 [Gemmatimonadetes bacterium]|nr:MAG: hypothetical protein CK550_00810 [Gemmatimonadota bacterium]